MTDIYPKRLDWRRILEDMRERGTSIYQAAKILGKPETTVQSWYRLKYPSEPSYSHGAAVLLLHARICGEDLTKRRCNEEVVYTEGENLT
jgi:hypothetical protein